MNDVFSAICFGEVLWDVLPDGAMPGGAPMNVAYHLNNLGKPSAIFSKVGVDDRGKEMLSFLKEKNISTQYVQKDVEHTTGSVIAKAGDNFEMMYDILKPVAYDFIEQNFAAEDAVAKAPYFIYGSLAARNAPSCVTLLNLLGIANTKVFDINLRPPHFEKSTIEMLLKNADILKLNEHELALVASWYGNYNKDIDKVKLLADQFHIQQIITTRGADGAAYYNGNDFYTTPGIPVQVADTIGSGDSFLAGFLAMQMDGKPVQQCLDFASRLGAFVATQKGACPHYNPQVMVQKIVGVKLP